MCAMRPLSTRWPGAAPAGVVSRRNEDAREVVLARVLFVLALGLDPGGYCLKKSATTWQFVTGIDWIPEMKAFVSVRT
jgi:hypothetical protein